MGFNTQTGSKAFVYADNISVDGSERDGGFSTDGELLIGNTASEAPKIGALTSPDGTISIGYSSPNITIQSVPGGSGSVIQRVTDYFDDVTKYSVGSIPNPPAKLPPTIADGVELRTIAITPQKSNSTIELEFYIVGFAKQAGPGGVPPALFSLFEVGPNARISTRYSEPIGTQELRFESYLKFRIPSTGVLARTFSLRMASTSPTIDFTINGDDNTAQYGGEYSYLTVTEVENGF